MIQSPEGLFAAAIEKAAKQPQSEILSELRNDCIQDLRIIVNEGETFKGVLGVAITSMAYKVLHPSQDIRCHQDGMRKGYSGRTFDTKYTTPFLKQNFPHYAMAESAWLTRSLEQPRPYDFKYPGKIRNKKVKTAFLNTLNRLQGDPSLALKMLVAFLSFMIETRGDEKTLFTGVKVSEDITISKIVEAVQQHIHYNYGKGTTGTARIPVLAIYSVYHLLLPEVKRYSNKVLAPIESHTSPDLRSRSVGDIEVKNEDDTCFEAVEVKHGEPISADMIDIAYRKIKNVRVDRYYILTTSDPNCDDHKLVMRKIAEYRQIHPCQIIVNGVLPSLKYYLRLVGDPNAFIDEYTKCLEQEYSCASGIKKRHLQVWQSIRQQMFRSK
jgi:DNA (cytosine-5)-methyltransferase 1